MLNKYRLKKFASEFRRTHDIGSSDPIRIKSLLQSLHVLTVFKPIKSSISGMAVKLDEDYRFILVNSNHSLGRQHFTILHELYHLYIQPDFKYKVCNTGIFNKNNLVEYYADNFAAYTLIPEEGILERIPDNELQKNKISITTVLDIEQYYSCSRTALLIRLNEIGLIDKKKLELLKQNICKTAQMFGYDTTLYKGGNHNLVIGDYGKKAKFLYDAEIISESDFMSLMKDIGIDINIDENNPDDKEI